MTTLTELLSDDTIRSGALASYYGGISRAVVRRSDAVDYVYSLVSRLGGIDVEAAGGIRRMDRYVGEIDLVAETDLDTAVDVSREIGIGPVDPATMTSVGYVDLSEYAGARSAGCEPLLVRMVFRFGPKGNSLLEATGCEDYVGSVVRTAYYKNRDLSVGFSSEEELFKYIGIPFIHPLLRTTASTSDYPLGDIVMSGSDVTEQVQVECDESFVAGKSADSVLTDRYLKTGTKTVLSSLGCGMTTPEFVTRSVTDWSRLARRMSGSVILHVTASDSCPPPFVLHEFLKAGARFVVDCDDESVLTARKALIPMKAVLTTQDEFERYRCS